MESQDKGANLYGVLALQQKLKQSARQKLFQADLEQDRKDRHVIQSLVQTQAKNALP